MQCWAQSHEPVQAPECPHVRHKCPLNPGWRAQQLTCPVKPVPSLQASQDGASRHVTDGRVKTKQHTNAVNLFCMTRMLTNAAPTRQDMATTADGVSRRTRHAHAGERRRQCAHARHARQARHQRGARVCGQLQAAVLVCARQGALRELELSIKDTTTGEALRDSCRCAGSGVQANTCAQVALGHACSPQAQSCCNALARPHVDI